jgi:hypothetical protein
VPPGTESTIEELLIQAEAAFANADAALRTGDLAQYQRWVDEAQRIIGEIADLVNAAQPNASVAHPL